MKTPTGNFCLLATLCFALGSTAFAGILYTDGPTNGTVGSLYIGGPGGGDSQQTISDGFVATASGTAVSLDFGEWVFPGQHPTSVSWALGTSPFASDISSGSTTQVGFILLIAMNSAGLDVYESHLDITGALAAGSTYYLTLSGALDSGGSPGSWDINHGPASCTEAQTGFPVADCGVAPPEGEAFTINGTPEPGSFMLLGSGILGLAGVLRRKLML